MKKSPNQTGDKIKLARKLRGLTQEELGRLMSMTAANVYLIESGRSDVNVNRLEAFAKVLGVEPADLLPGDDVLVNVVDTDNKIINMIMAAAPGLSGNTSIGLVIPDNSMFPAYREGDKVTGEKRPIAECNGRDCIVELAGKLTTRRVILSADGNVMLFTYDPRDHPIIDVQLQWAAPIDRVERP